MPNQTQLYFNSFLPSTLRAWNELPVSIRNLKSVASFKKAIQPSGKGPPKYFNVGSRKAQVLHTRLRTGCSALNFDLFSKGIVSSPLCHCGSIENVQHFFMCCPKYDSIRATLFDSIRSVCTPCVNILLYGDTSLHFNANILIFENVHLFIINSNRF